MKTNAALFAMVTLALTASRSFGQNDPSGMLAFVAQTEPPKDTTASAWYAEKDRTLRKLALHYPPVPNLTAQLVALVESPGIDTVTRDYILQHLQLEVLPQVSQTEREAIINTLRNSLRLTASTTAGTALLAMQRLARSDASISTAEIEAAALSILTNIHASGLSRATALQVESSIAPEKAARIAVDLDTATSPLLRQVAGKTAADGGLVKRDGCVGCAQQGARQ